LIGGLRISHRELKVSKLSEARDLNKMESHIEN